ncbi:MAG: hypothetical protein BGO67_09325 [Alphaproteobacteria bacterium 41-28]|nr:MAG: hypothetical protein BGO67_09325 [Alphaproteobacteria bacterium 41-28]
MELSIFLAKAIGLYYVIISLGMILNGGRIKALLMEIMNNSALLFITGFFALILGILLVTSHNIWVADWRVLITLLGWGALLKGIMLVTLPQLMIEASKKWVQNTISYYITMCVVFLIGIFLLYHGYVLN